MIHIFDCWSTAEVFDISLYDGAIIDGTEVSLKMHRDFQYLFSFFFKQY